MCFQWNPNDALKQAFNKSPQLSNSKATYLQTSTYTWLYTSFCFVKDDSPEFHITFRVGIICCLAMFFHILYHYFGSSVVTQKMFMKCIKILQFSIVLYCFLILLNLLSQSKLHHISSSVLFEILNPIINMLLCLMPILFFHQMLCMTLHFCEFLTCLQKNSIILIKTYSVWIDCRFCQTNSKFISPAIKVLLQMLFCRSLYKLIWEPVLFNLFLRFNECKLFNRLLRLFSAAFSDACFAMRFI